MRKTHRRITSLLLSVLIMLALMPAAAFAETDDQAGGGTVRMIAGEMLSGFEGYTSKDPTVAWVDGSGRLCAMKEGETTVTTATESGTFTRKVSVSRYDDGSPVVGRLKILARYNDSMQFYDGHTYLLFTSYKDGVKISVDDLYAGYEISDTYYRDIKNDISAGSNHTGTDADKYFSYRNDMKSVTLDRGEIVTIGMYRDFDLTVPQAALGSLQNSTLWGGLRREGKTAAIENLFALVDMGDISLEKAINNCKALIKEAGLDYRKWTDGVVNGGVCFNRELYNQKLEWDQYENVTYELDITQKQLNALTGTLGGNGGNFSIMRNSCATVAVNAWNAAVGTRDGEDTSYKLYKNGSGIFSDFDAPKTVKESIMNRLPGYYLNNSEEVQEPDAGFRDETGWVYVSAPEKLDGGDAPSQDETTYNLDTYVTPADDLKFTTDIYTIGDDGKRVPVGDEAAFEEGRKIFVKVTDEAGDESKYALKDITMNGVSFMDANHFDTDKEAYFITMPAKKSSRLRVLYEQTETTVKESKYVQVEKGETIDISDYAEFSKGSGRMKWIILQDEDSILTYADDAQKVLAAGSEGSAVVWACAGGNENIGVVFFIDVYEDRDSMAEVTYDDSGSIDVMVTDDIGALFYSIPRSGYLVPKGTKLQVYPAWDESKVFSSLKAGGRSIASGKTFSVDQDTKISYKTRAASIEGVPETISLKKKGSKYQLRAKTRYDDLLVRLLPVYDSSITYISSDPLVSVSDDGLIKVEGDIPEGGMAVYVTAYAGSSGYMVSAPCKVIVGNYNGTRTVGTLTIHARTVNKGELVAHAALTFTAKEDCELSASYYEYYKPKAEFIELLNEYPDKYKGDPALYNDNELDMDRATREAYFEKRTGRAGATPADISIKKGESFSASAYSYDPSNLTAMLRAFENGDMASSTDTAELIRQIKAYQGVEGSGEFDPEKAFDSLASTIANMYRTCKDSGKIAANGHSEGGVFINREMYNQFRRDDSQMPNNYYSVDITAEEYTEMAKYLSNPANNYYSIFSKNCGSAAKDIWNAALSDRPELRLKANYTNMMEDPESLYIELGLLRLKNICGGKGGTNFYPRAVEIVKKSCKPVTPKPAQSGTQTAVTYTAPAAVTSAYSNPLNVGLNMDITNRGKMTLRWGKVAGASGYDIYVRTDDGRNICSKKTATVKSGKKLSKKLSRLKGKKINPDKTYRFVVRAYKKIGRKKVYIASSSMCIRNGSGN